MTVPNCCCCDLRTGCFILGLLTVILSSLNLIGSMNALVHIDEINDMVRESVETEYPDSPTYCDNECIQLVEQTVLGVFVTALVWNALSLMAGGLLLVGVQKKQPCLLHFYLAHLGVHIGAACLYAVLCVVVMFSNGYVGSALLLAPVIYLAITCYFFDVVRSYKQEMHRELNQDHTPLVEVEYLYKPAV